jgi:hypothetical protein
MYPRLSREELGGRFLGPLAYLDPKGDGDQSMPDIGGRAQALEAARRGTRVIWRRLDCLNPKSPDDESTHPSAMTPDADAAFCPGLIPGSGQPPERGALPSEGR